MTNTADKGSDYTDPHTHSFATEGAAATTAKKPNKFFKVILLVVGVLFLAIAGFVGWGLMKPKPVPAPAPAPLSAPPADPVVETPAPIEAPVVDAAPLNTPIDPSAVPLDSALAPAPIDGAGLVDPVSGLPVDQSGVNTPAVVAPTDPSALNAPVQVNPVVDPSANVSPPPVVAPTPTVMPAPSVAVVNDPANSGLTQVMDSARQDMVGALDRIEKRLGEMETRFNNRFANLDARMSGLERGRNVAPLVNGNNAGSTPIVRKKRPQVVKPKVVAPRPAQQNRLEIIDSASLAPVSRAVIIDAGTSQMDTREVNRVQVLDAAPVVDVRPAQSASCSIRSIQPGRVWVKRSNGSFATYGVGDALPDGRQVDSIDPDAGVMAGGRSWNCG